MTRKRSAVPVVASLILLAACDATNHMPTAPVMRAAATPEQLAVPADGNGKKVMYVLDIASIVSCPGGSLLTRHITGYVQVMTTMSVEGPTLEIDTAVELYTFTSSSGASYIWREVGGERVWIEDGDVLASYNGRIPGNIGRTVVDLTTQTVVSETGNDVDMPRLLACAALT